MRTLRAAAALLAFVLVGSALAADEFETLHVADLAALIDRHAPNLFVYDVNPASVRESQGVIPGAHLLPSARYEVSSELPRAKDAKLVFYCANTH